MEQPTQDEKRPGAAMDVRHFLFSLIKMIGPNSMILVNLLLLVFYLQAGEAISPHWKEVAVGALVLVGTLTGFAVKTLLGEFGDLKRSVKESNDKQDQRHRANLKALVGIVQALKTGKTENLDATDVMDIETM